MNFECLANELLLDVFEYLDTKDLFQAFDNLNIRLKSLLFLHGQLHGYWNFQSISQTIFHIICREYLNRIIAIHLSDHDETPEQIQLFFSYHFQFSNLQSLSLSYISSETILTHVITIVPQLTHLKISQCRVDHDIINDGSLFDQIWSLKNLTYCYFQREKYLWNPFFIAPTVPSHSIQSLYLEGFSYIAQELHSLFSHTINLTNLTIDVEYNYDYQPIFTKIVSIKKLQIFVQHSSYITSHLLQHMPNLIHLRIELAYILLDGHQWKEIIDNYLPNLKQFQMKMELHLRDNDSKEEQIDRLLDSFRQPFWIDQHRWFIQCHWYMFQKFSKAYLYTLPYYFKELQLISDLQLKSTLPNNDIQWSFQNVENVLVKNSICPLIRFDHWKYLKITLPLKKCFWSNNHDFKRLNSLNVILMKNVNSSIQLESLVRKATGLYSLTLSGEMFSEEILFNLRSSSIRRLNLYDFGCFNREQCQNLISSPLASQCEVLLITINDRSSILDLVNRLNNLRVLNVRSQDDKWKREDEDEFVRWLKDSLSQTCIIKRECMHGISYVQIWIR